MVGNFLLCPNPQISLQFAISRADTENWQIILQSSIRRSMLHTLLVLTYQYYFVRTNSPFA